LTEAPHLPEVDITSCNSFSMVCCCCYYCSIRMILFRFNHVSCFRTEPLTVNRLEVEQSYCFSQESSMVRSYSKALFVEECYKEAMVRS